MARDILSVIQQYDTSIIISAREKYH